MSAPETEKSGAGHSFTFKSPLRARRVALPGLEHIEAYAVGGTPADCVKIAYGNLTGKADLVITGINLGANLGTDCFYSGTVAAAMEGVFNGMRAIAVSNVSFEPKNFGACLCAADYAMRLMERCPNVSLLNVNAPDCAKEELKGIRLTAMCRQEYSPEYEMRRDPYGGPYYWASSNRKCDYANERDDDDYWTANGYASVTPLLADLTDFALLARLKADQGV